jgi:hypothetical protein
MRLFRILFCPDPPDPAAGGAADPGNATPAPANPAPAPGPAAAAVNNGRTERELQLERDLETERSSHAQTTATKREREQKISELEDQLQRLRQEPAQPKRGALGVRVDD